MLDDNDIYNVNLKEDEFDKNIRPETLDDYVGQEEIKENLKVFIKACKMRNEVLDHVLLYGPPGLGKTTLAHIIANELGVNIKTASGPSIEKPGDLAAILSNLEEGDVLFIDEIHRMPRFIEEILYPAMEDFELDIVVGQDGNTRNIKIDLPPFTLVGATTRAGNISSPLRDRFGIVSKLNYYTDEELKQIIIRTSKGVRDFTLVAGDKTISLETTKKALNRLKIDEYGLDSLDLEYLDALITKFNGGPVGAGTIATSIGEEVTTVEEVVEPFLLQEGFVKRSQRGRIATEKAYRHLGIAIKK